MIHMIDICEFVFFNYIYFTIRREKNKEKAGPFREILNKKDGPFWSSFGKKAGPFLEMTNGEKIVTENRAFALSNFIVHSHQWYLLM